MKIDEQGDDLSIYREIGARIRNSRIREHLKQEELAERAGVSRFAVMGLERGEGGTKLSTLISVLRQLRLLHALDVVLPEIMLTPIEVAELESRRRKSPKRVRTSGKRPVGLKVWGDGTRIEG